MDPEEEDNESLAAALSDARLAAERQTRLAEQANRRVQELEQELQEVEEHVAGLEDELRKSQGQATRLASEKLLLKEQVSHLERDLRSVAAESEGGREEVTTRKKLGRCKTDGHDGLRDLDSAKEAQFSAEMALDAAKREHEEVVKVKDAELENQRYHMGALQEQHMQLQQYCSDLRSASQEIQGFLERCEAENGQLQRELLEMREVLEAHHLDKALKHEKGTAQVDFVGGASLAEEMEELAQMEATEDPTSVQLEVQKPRTKSVTLEVEPEEASEAPKRSRPKLRRSSSSVAASKLAALQEEYEEKFENQSQQLQSALVNKERIEREKQEAIDSLQKQIEELKGRLPETGGDALAGLFQMMSRIKELTAEASDAVLLGFASPEAVGYATATTSTAAPPKAALPEPKAEALKFNSSASSTVRSRLQERRSKKAPAVDSDR